MSVSVADAEITPIELEIIYNALTAAAAEMDVTIWRTSRSTIVRELLDYSTAIFDRDGWNVAQAARIPSHLNSMSYFLTEILARHIAPDRWGPDDIVISNDPYCGGQHLPDIVAYKAVFRNGRRIGFVGALCHHLDVGGSSPGSYGSSATALCLAEAHVHRTLYLDLVLAAPMVVTPSTGRWRRRAVVRGAP